MADCPTTGNDVLLVDIPEITPEQCTGDEILYGENPDGDSHEIYDKAVKFTLPTIATYVQNNTLVGGGVAVQDSSIEVVSSAQILNFDAGLDVTIDGNRASISSSIDPENYYTKTQVDVHTENTGIHAIIDDNVVAGNSLWSSQKITDDLLNKEPVFSKNTAFNKSFGTGADTVCEGNDVRLGDARPPIAHAHLETDITDLDKYTRAQVDVLVTSLQNQVDNKENSFTKNTAFNRDFGTTTSTVCEGDDLRLSDSRPPSGAAGGVLGGTYPNPTFQVDMATQSALDSGLSSKANTSDVLTKDNTTEFVPTLDYHPATKKFVLDNMGGIGVSDHGELAGLSDDDHPQYHDDGRGDIRYYTKAQVDASLTGKEPNIIATTVADYYRGDKTFQPLDKSTVGLSNVDNTSDVNKPVSTLQQAALDSKADLVGGTVPAAQLPSYVDDVLEYANLASFPVTGESGKIYIATDTNLSYRWTGSAYVLISSDDALWGNIAGTLSNQTDLNDALSNRQLTSEKNAVNGYAGLDAGGLVALAQIPDMLASKISDFDAQVSGNSDVTANTNARHNPVTVATASDINFSVTASQAISIGLPDVVTSGTYLNTTVNSKGIVTGGDNNLPAITGSDVVLDSINASPYDTVQKMQDIYHSTGFVDGMDVVDNGDATINLTSGNGYVREADNPLSVLKVFSFGGASNLTLTDNSENWVLIEHGVANPTVVVTTSKPVTIYNRYPVAVIFREGLELHINPYVRPRVGDHAGLMIKRLEETTGYNGIGHSSGMAIGATGTLQFAAGAGKFWYGLNDFTIPSFDISTGDTFTAVYQDGVGGWSYITNQTAINNTQYDDGSGTLATAGNNKYIVFWVYVETDGDVIVLFGRGAYDLSEADLTTEPSNVPPRISTHGVLIGRIILQESATVFTDIQSIFVKQVASGVPSEQAGLTFDGTNNTGSLSLQVNTFYTNLNPVGATQDYTLPVAVVGEQVGFSVNGVSESVVVNLIGTLRGNVNPVIDRNGEYLLTYVGGSNGWLALGGVGYAN